MRDLLTYHKDASTRVQTIEGTGATLVANTTYYVDLTEEEGEQAGLSSICWKYDAAIVLTSITVEATNFPELQVYDAAALGFFAVTAVPTVTAAGGSAAVAGGSWADQGHGRLRAKIVVGATGGNLRGAVHHKDRY